MQLINPLHIILIIVLSALVFYGLYRISKYAFFLNTVLLLGLIAYRYYPHNTIKALLYLGCPLLLVNIKKWSVTY